MNVLIIDDDKNFAQKLKDNLLTYISQYDESVHIDIKNEDFKNLHFYKDYRMIFIDIELIDVNGIQLAKQINSIIYKPHIIFTSSHNKYIQPSLVVHPYYFIDKSKYKKDINILFSLLDEEFNQDYYLLINYKDEKGRICVTNIKYIESSNHMINIYTNDGIIYHDNRRLKDILEELPYDKFIQINKSYIINFEFMTTHTSTSVNIFKNIQIPIGKKYRENFKNRYEEYLLK